MGTKASDGSLAASQVLISLAGFGSHPSPPAPGGRHRADRRPERGELHPEDPGGVTVTVTTSASTTYRKRGLTSASLTDVRPVSSSLVMGEGQRRQPGRQTGADQPGGLRVALVGRGSRLA